MDVEVNKPGSSEVSMYVTVRVMLSKVTVAYHDSSDEVMNRITWKVAFSFPRC
jgi:hypothetical protein